MSWFNETLYDGFRQGHKIVKTLYRGKSAYQKIEVFETQDFGRMLALDGVVQTTERDEFVYHEMMTHLPIFAHGQVESILIIGAGDGGILEEALKHKSVKRAVMVEIDGQVIEVSKKYLPKICGKAFSDKRAEVIVGDGAKFMAETEERFDLVIVDSSDPIGPATVLFESPFYRNCKRVMKPRAILVNQNGVPMMQGPEVTSTYRLHKKIFKQNGFYAAAVPTYICGFMTLGWAADWDIRKVSPAVLEKRMKASQIKGLKYYNPAVGQAAFALPNYIQALMK